MASIDKKPTTKRFMGAGASTTRDQKLKREENKPMSVRNAVKSP